MLHEAWDVRAKDPLLFRYHIQIEKSFFFDQCKINVHKMICAANYSSGFSI